MNKQDIDYQKEIRKILRQVTILPNKEILKITKHLKCDEGYTPQLIASYERLVKLTKTTDIYRNTHTTNE